MKKIVVTEDVLTNPNADQFQFYPIEIYRGNQKVRGNITVIDRSIIIAQRYLDDLEKYGAYNGGVLAVKMEEINSGATLAIILLDSQSRARAKRNIEYCIDLHFRLVQEARKTNPDKPIVITGAVPRLVPCDDLVEGVVYLVDNIRREIEGGM